MTFRVQTNRDIAVKSFEMFPDLIEYLFKKQNQKIESDNDFFINAIKDKELSKLFNMNDKISELIEFALPLMLESAKDTTNPKDIISYAIENNAQEIFNSTMLDFLVQGFTPREQEKPKIQFSMK
jgi:predicted nucleotidyltransferase